MYTRPQNKHTKEAKYPTLHTQASMVKLCAGDVDVPGQLEQVLAAEVDRQSFRREHTKMEYLLSGKIH